MTWGKLLQPDLVLGDSVIGLTPDIVRRHRLRGLVLDVDETLVPIRCPQTDQAVRAWCEQMKPLVSLWLVSNNLNETRIRRIAQSVDVPYIMGARKPSRRKLRQAIYAMDLPIQQIAMVGDRLFTDVLAGNRLGLFTILVDPMITPGEVARYSWVRAFEVWLSQKLGVSLQTFSS